MFWRCLKRNEKNAITHSSNASKSTFCQKSTGNRFAIFPKNKNIEHRICLKFCIANGISCTESLKMLQKTYGESTLSKTRVYEWYSSFKSPCRNCPTCPQVPIRARSDFPHVDAGGHMVWSGSEPHRIIIDKIIFKFCVVVVIL